MNRIEYILTAKSKYNIHSPFIFDFYCNVIEPQIELEKKNHHISLISSRDLAIIYKIVILYKPTVVIKLLSANVDVDEIIKKISPNSVIKDFSKCDKIELFDMFIIDANLLNIKKCFENYLKLIKNTSFFIVLGIHSSKANELVWSAIKNDTVVKVTIDLFSLGIVFFRKELSKENYILR